jgi:hypothetical protein
MSLTASQQGCLLDLGLCVSRQSFILVILTVPYYVGLTIVSHLLL